jgi:hypothetical protein
VRKAWQEAIDAAIAAQQPHAAPGPLALQLIIAVDALRDIRDAHDAGTMAHDAAHKALDDIGTPGFGESQPAPELAAAMAALARVRQMCERPADVAGHSSGSGIVSGTNLAAAILRELDKAGPQP